MKKIVRYALTHLSYLWPRWGFGLIYLSLIILGLYLLRSLIPKPPEPESISIMLACVYIWFSTTQTVITRQTSINIYDRPSVFFNEAAWQVINFILLIVQIGIGGYFLYRSWKWLVFVFLLNWVLFLSGFIRSTSWLLIIPIHFVFLKRD